MKVSLIQLRVSSEETSAQRWSRAEQYLAQLEQEAPDLVLFPELWSVGFSHFDAYEFAAEPLRGTTVLRLAPWARRLHVHILTGSFVERNDSGLCNTMVMLDANGLTKGVYRKMHLFGYDSQERALLTAGRNTSEILTPYGVIGLATCYDLRFPEQFRHMVDNGATIFAVSAAWPKARLEDWRLFCRVRALENQSFLFACNHTGECAGTVGAGHSMVVAPDGTVLAEAGEEEQVVTTELDLNEIQRFRKQFPALRDRIEIKS